MRSAASDRLLVSITANPAMLIWLSGTDNRKDAPNENYGRELMELFTLGEGNGYTERDVREQARALTGWTSTWKRGKGQTDFRFDSKRHDIGTKTVFGKQGHVLVARLGLALHPPPEARAVLRHQAVELLRPRSRRTRRRAPGWRRSTARASRCAPCSTRSSATPRSTPARGWSSHRSSTSPASCAGSTAGSTPRRGSGCPRAPASGCSTHRTWPAGTTRAGSTRTRSAAAGRSRTPPSRRCTLGDKKGKKGAEGAERPRGDRPGRARGARQPDDPSRDPAELLAFARGSLKDATGWKAESYPPLVANAVRQLLAVSPDLQTC